ncbi:MAG: hypothetical protein JXD23_01600 [Spirochaetales bacterium]|nr:hypothetical protein [Spirochaetales bacterium]
MTRIEIIANNSVEEDVVQSLDGAVDGLKFSKINNVHGIGRSYPKMGSNIWPEENFILLIYCDDREAGLVKNAVRALKRKFPEEGIKFFSMKCGAD